MPPAGAPGSSGTREELRKLRRHTPVYGAGVVLNKLASFLMLPIYTRFLTPADYGVLELLSMTVELIGTFSGMRLAAGVSRLHANAGSEAERNRVLSTAVLAMSAIALGTAAGGILFSSALNHLVLGADGRPLYFQLFFLIYLFQTLGTIPALALRLHERSGLWVGTSFAKLVLQLSLNTYFVVELQMGVLGVLVGNVVATGVTSLVLVLWTLRRAGFHFSRVVYRSLASYGNPLIVWSLGNFILVLSDRFFLKHFADVASVGIYSLAYKFAFVLTAFAFHPFFNVWDPQRFTVARRPDAGEVYSRVFVYLNLVLGTIALVMALFARDVIEVMAAPAFHPAAELVPPLLAAQIVFHWVSYCNVGILVSGHTGRMAHAAVVGVVATLALNFLLIPRFGVYGATAATLVAYGARFASVYLFAQRTYRIPYHWTPILKLYALYAAAGACRYALQPASRPASLAVGALIALAALGAGYRFVLTAEERAYVRRTVGRRSRAVLGLARL